LERVRGIEPLSSAWKAEVLPLHNTRMLAEDVGFEPTVELPLRRFSKPLL
jgi:hypothetical protein